MNETILEIVDLEVTTKSGARVLRDVSLSIERGCIAGLVGESGSGKTMICKAVLDILPSAARVTRGTIRLDGQDILVLGPRQRRALLGRSLTMILQNPMTALNPVYRIGRQISDVLKFHLGLSQSEARRRTFQLLEAVHIRDPERVVRLYPHELSGGMCQRVAISIAFACEPRFIVADEPTTALDVTAQHQVLRLIRELQRKLGVSLLFVTHDLGVVSKICDTVNVIHAGRVVESSTTVRFFSEQRHEYSSALLAAMPRYDQPDRVLRAIPSSLRTHLDQNEIFEGTPRNTAHA